MCFSTENLHLNVTTYLRCRFWFHQKTEPSLRINSEIPIRIPFSLKLYIDSSIVEQSFRNDFSSNESLNKSYHLCFETHLVENLPFFSVSNDLSSPEYDYRTGTGRSNNLESIIGIYIFEGDFEVSYSSRSIRH